MTTLHVIESRPEHAALLSANLRRGDILEVEATGLKAKQAVWRSYRASHMRKSYFVDGKIAAMMGCSGGMLSDIGHPWLLTTPEVEKIPITFVKEAKKGVAEMLERHSELNNYVDASYHQALRLLSVLGFTIGMRDVIHVGVRRLPFLSFEMRR